MFKKFIPWIIGTVLFMSAGGIVTMFIDTDTSSTADLVRTLQGGGE
jgi:hypothetical protein